MVLKGMLLVLAVLSMSSIALGQSDYGIGAGVNPSNLCSLADGQQRQLAALMMSAAGSPGFSTGLVGALMDANAGGCLDDFTTTMGQAINGGGAPVTMAVAQGLAVASSNGRNNAQGQVVAKATAIAICKGGMTATAVSRAWAQAITINSQGCEVLTEAFAQAVATCGNGVSKSKSFATTFTIPLGYCQGNGATGTIGDINVNAILGNVNAYVNTLLQQNTAYTSLYG